MFIAVFHIYCISRLLSAADTLITGLTLYNCKILTVFSQISVEILRRVCPVAVGSCMQDVRKYNVGYRVRPGAYIVPVVVEGELCYLQS